MVLDRSDLEFILKALAHDRLTSCEMTRRTALRMRLADFLSRPPHHREPEFCVGVPKE